MPAGATAWRRLAARLRRDGAWRTLRRVGDRVADRISRGRRPDVLSDPAGHLVWRIDRFSLFQGRLRLAGLVEAPGTSVRSISLRLPDGRAWRVSGGAEFDATLDVEAGPVEVAAAWLEVAVDAKGTFAVRDLGHAPDDPAHALVARFREQLAARPAGRVLEVGARARSGVVRRDVAPAGWAYEGFDIVDGPNVDTVGDAHQLTAAYSPQSFDAVMAFSVLEHVLMPWKFVIELNRVLKPGAIGLFTTHQCWPLHDEPWDFWRFSDSAWRGLLNAATGFEILEARMGEPAFVVAARLHAGTGFAEVPAGALASFVLFRKTGETQLDWPVDPLEILPGTYPVQTLR